MRAMILLLSAFLSLPLAAFSQSVTLPSEIKGTVGGIVFVVPKVDGGPVRWRFDPRLTDITVPIASVFGVDPTKSVGKIFQANEPGKYLVEAWNAKGDRASDIAVCWVVIGTFGPAPPVPPTPSPKTVAHITFVGAEKSPQSLATNNDTDLRAWLKERGIKVHILKSSDPLIESSGLTIAVSKAGGAPCLVVQDEVGNVIGQETLTTVAAVKNYVLQFGR